MYNPFSLEGKTILITGASSGIGRETAIECSKLGAQCIIVGRNKERLRDTIDQMSGSGHQYISIDLTETDSLSVFIKELPQIDGLVNNAGVAYSKPIQFIKQKDIDTVFSINTYAPVLLTKMLLKSKKIKNGGSIIFTSSIAAINEVVGNSIYGMSKAAVMSFAKYCALECSDKHIRVNSIHPGMVKTELLSKIVFSEDELKSDMDKYPLGRYGNPKEIALAIIYFLSDASSWVTGTQFVIDGGLHLV